MWCAVTPCVALYVVLYVALFVSRVDSSHFRGGSISWKPVSDTSKDVRISYRVSWRRDWDGTTFCNDATITSGNTIGIDMPMRCYERCSGTITRMYYYCTDYSEIENWSTGTREITNTFPGVGPFVVGYESCCWISSLKQGADGDWDVRMTIDLTVRDDTGHINTSPVTATPPIVRLKFGCTEVFRIPVSDADGDSVRCRWAEAPTGTLHGTSKHECGDVCRAFSTATLDEVADAVQALSDHQPVIPGHIRPTVTDYSAEYPLLYQT